MQVNSLKQYIDLLESENELIRIKEFVDPELEITEFSDRIMKQKGGGKAILFENTGTDFPLLINHYGSDKRILSALGISSFEEPSKKIDTLMGKMMGAGKNFKSKLALLPELKNASKWMPQKSSVKAPCQEIVHKDPDLSILPVLKCWPFDGGPFATLPMVITEDPETGIRNIGMYRMQIFDKNTTGMHWHLHKGGAAHYNKYKELGKKMPVTVVFGGDPVLTYCATAPLHENIDEFMLAGFLKDKKVKLIKSLTNNIYIPASSDIVIEGFIDPNEDLKKEGPFGDHTGFYSLDDLYPVFHVTCITHRKDAVYPATIVGIPPMEDFYIGKATERIFLKPIKITIAPEILDIRLPAYGVAHNLVFIKTKNSYAGQSFKIMNALLGAVQMMFSKVLICFNEDTDIQDDLAVIKAINKNFSINNIMIGKGPSDVLDHSAYTYTLSGKLLIDLTQEIDKNQTDIFSIISEYKSPLQFNDKIKQIRESKDLSSKKIIAFIDNFVELDSEYLKAWYILNNIDPSHDCIISDGKLFLDACIKTNETGFERRWPNPVIMNDKTIKSIDNKWEMLTKYNFIESPSIKLKKLQIGDNEIVNI
ncbi:MAG: menaquinone biosynthesis decarboxylase [Marinilabiliales bacterium]|nr:MAG: menaquinone biosynthesis decarboxylase [Marinilabiliales bacterium]